MLETSGQYGWTLWQVEAGGVEKSSGYLPSEIHLTVSRTTLRRGKAMPLQVAIGQFLDYARN